MKTRKNGILVALITILLPLLLTACGGGSNNNQPPQTCTVRFEANGGSPTPVARSVRQGEAVSAPTPAPTRLGFHFDGWYSNPALTPDAKITFPYTITENITMYAKWISVEDAVSIPAISAGDSFTVALKTDGSLWAWGNIYSDLLGDSMIISRNIPTQIGTDEDWAVISAGNGHAIALKRDGSLWAWGYNFYGQLGDGTDGFRTDRNSPIQIGIDKDWSDISAGYCHTVALKTDGSLWTWGWNANGQLGDDTNTIRNVPMQIGKDKDWATISAGAYHTIALKKDGSLWAWGANGSGQLGDGTDNVSRYSPVRIGTEANWASISGGYAHTIALKMDGSLWAWGWNHYGQLGDGTNMGHTAPMQVGTDKDWSAISAWSYHTIALKTDGSLWAWGYNNYGQLGDDTDMSRNTPVQIGIDKDWSAISAGGFDMYSHTAALKTDGSLWAWGYNGYGELGDGTFITRYSPVKTMLPASLHEFY